MINIMYVFLATSFGGAIIGGICTYFISPGWSAVIGYLFCFIVISAIINKIQPFNAHTDSFLAEHDRKELNKMTDKQKLEQAKEAFMVAALVFFVPNYLAYKVGVDIGTLDPMVGGISGTLLGFFVMTTIAWLLKDKM